MYSLETKQVNFQLGINGGLSEEYKTAASEDENFSCICCMRNRRMRNHVQVVLDAVKCENQEEFAKKMRQENLRVLVTSYDSIFFDESPFPPQNYIRSCFFGPEHEPGSTVQGKRHENLEKLSFSDSSLDLIINSAVLEHVHLLDSALKEINRVLKPGGLHIFTVPIDSKIEFTRQRARARGDKIINLLPPIYHGDNIFDNRVLVYHDFGADFADLVKKNGFTVQAFATTDTASFGVPVFLSRKI